MIHKMLMPDVSGLLLVAGTWAPQVAFSFEATVKWAQLIGLMLGIMVSLLAVIDFFMKIKWKMRRIKEEKEAARREAEEAEKKQEKKSRYVDTTSDIRTKRY